MRHLALLLVLAGVARADGKVFGRVAPVVEMPDQRAILWFEDGRERLAIDTAFSGEGEEFAWVVPLPSVPQVSAVSPGTFTTVQALLVPAVQPRREPTWPIAAVLLVSILLLSLVKRRWLRLLLLLPTVVGLLGAVIVAVPLGAKLDFAGVTVHGEGAVGSYDVATLSAENPADVLAWLDTHGFRVAPEARDIVRRYAEEGWTFAAARLHSKARPHPLRFDFATDDAIYPLRLTGTAGGPLKLDLYVFGDRQATADRLRAVHCAAVEADENVDIDPLYHRKRISLAHAGLRGLADGATVVTKLSATLTPDDMATDLRLGWTESEAFWPVLVTRENALVRGADAAAWAALISFFVLLAVAAAVRRDALAPGRQAPRWVWAGTALAAVVAGFLAHPFRYDLLDRDLRARTDTWSIYGDHQELAKELAGRSDPEALRARARRHWRGKTNPYTGGPVREDDSPGNYVVETDGGRATYAWFDARGARFERGG